VAEQKQAEGIVPCGRDRAKPGDLPPGQQLRPDRVVKARLNPREGPPSTRSNTSQIEHPRPPRHVATPSPLETKGAWHDHVFNQSPYVLDLTTRHLCAFDAALKAVAIFRVISALADIDNPLSRNVSVPASDGPLFH
jgi:hypothetical protein